MCRRGRLLMRLADFIETDTEAILAKWEALRPG